MREKSTIPFTICKARFIGADGSLGFRNGSEYVIKIYFGNKIYVSCKDHLTCPYDTENALLKNWEIHTGECTEQS